MNFSIRFLAYFLVLATISGCQNKENTDLLNKITELEKKIENIKSAVELNEILSKLGSNNIAYLRPGHQGYSVISFDLGKLTIKILDVSQYAGGVKVTFDLGNPLSADIIGLTANLEYGEVDEKGSPKGETKRKEVKFESELKSGSWGRSTVVLEGIDLSKFGYVRVKDMSHSQIKLRKYQ